MKRIISMLASALVVATLSAQNETKPNETTVIYQPDSVVVNNSDNSHRVEVFGRRDDPDFHYVKEVLQNDSTETVESKDWSFASIYSRKTSTVKYPCSEYFSGGLSIGWISAVGLPSGVDLRNGKSFELAWEEIIGYRYYFNRRHSVSVGMGIDWKKYALSGDNRFVNSDRSMTIERYPEGSTSRFSRVLTYSMVVPFKYTYRLNKHNHISLGVLLNFNNGSMKTKYRDAEGNMHKIKSTDIHQRQFTVDFKAEVNLVNGMGLYIKYSPMNVFKDDFGPKFHSVSFGLACF